MIYGLHLSAQGARTQSSRLDVIANNLANASTTGFKRSFAVFQDHKPYDVEHGVLSPVPGDLNESTGGTTVAGVFTNHESGPLNQTGAPLDVAVVGDGFLKVQSPSGETFLTRNGNFTTNSNGELTVGNTGYKVLGTGGEPLVFAPGGGEIHIADDGTISQSVEGARTVIGRLALVKPASENALRPVGRAMYQSNSSETPLTNARVKQGFLESSGVKPVMEMLSMIEASRAFETNINMMKFQDEALSRLLQGVTPR
ncbi:MAG: flagellar basal-body rod protein FlgG [Planctomycetaceae bacterium]